METNTEIQCQGRTAASSPVIHAVMAQEIPVWRILVISLPGFFTLRSIWSSGHQCQDNNEDKGRERASAALVLIINS